MNTKNYLKETNLNVHTQPPNKWLFEAVSGGKFEMDTRIVSIGVYQKRSSAKNTLVPPF